jgi:hypothetical protein
VSAFLRLQTLSQRFAISYIAASTTIFVWPTLTINMLPTTPTAKVASTPI